MEDNSENRWPMSDSSLSFDISPTDLDALLHTDWLSFDLRGYSWDGSPSDCSPSPFEETSMKPLPGATRQSSTSSTSSIQPSYGILREAQILDVLPEAQALDGSSNYEITTGIRTLNTTDIPALHTNADTDSGSSSMPYQNSPGTMSPDGLSRTTRLYEGDYITAKQKSLIHRRKQNRESQCTFRQRKELERIELQAKLETTIKTCEELKTKVKKLEDENLNLRLSGWDLQAK